MIENAKTMAEDARELSGPHAGRPSRHVRRQDTDAIWRKTMRPTLIALTCAAVVWTALFLWAA